MEFHRWVIDLEKKDDHIYLEPHGDQQIGSLLVDYYKLHNRINALKEKERYTILMGDMCDNINAYAGGRADGRFDPTLIDPLLNTFERQAKKAVELYTPYKHKIGGALFGNHEWKTVDYERFTGQICEPLGIPFLGAMCMINLSCYYNKQQIGSFVIWACHGAYAGMQVGGGVNRLKQLAGLYEADIYLHAHTHDKLTYEDINIVYEPKHNDMKKVPKIYALTGTFQDSQKKGVLSYIDRAPKLRLSKVGTITIELDPLNHEMHAHE